jgi:hypothetical protein
VHLLLTRKGLEMRKTILTTLFVVCLASIALAQTDQITLTTYYPAPFGMYQEMRVMGKLGVGTTDPKNKLDVNGSVAIGSYAGNNVAPTASLIVSGRVGVGTTNPLTPFHAHQEAMSFVSPSALGVFETGANQPALIAASRRGHSFTSGDAKLPSDNIGLYALGYDGTKANNEGFAGYFALGKTYFADSVGVGTTSPAARLTVDDGSGAYSTSGNNPLGLFVTGTKNKPALSVISANQYGVSQPDLSNTALYVHGSTYAGYFDSGKVYISGNVGVGTSLPNAKLEVIGSLKKGPTTASTEEVLVPSNMSASIYQNTGLCDSALPATALTTIGSCNAIPAQCKNIYGAQCSSLNSNLGVCSTVNACGTGSCPGGGGMCCIGTVNCSVYAASQCTTGARSSFCYWYVGQPATNNTFVGRMYPTP